MMLNLKGQFLFFGVILLNLCLLAPCLADELEENKYETTLSDDAYQAKIKEEQRLEKQRLDEIRYRKKMEEKKANDRRWDRQHGR